MAPSFSMKKTFNSKYFDFMTDNISDGNLSYQTLTNYIEKEVI